MDSFFQSFAAAAHGLTAQAARLRTTSENIANADTPGYHRKLVTFEQQMTEDGANVLVPGPVTFSNEELPKVYDPAHPLAGPDGNYLGSNVDLMVEIADAREAQRSYEANLRMLDQSRQMATSFLELLRR